MFKQKIIHVCLNGGSEYHIGETQKSQKHKHKNKNKNKQQLPQMCLLKKTLIQRMDRQLQSPDLMQDKLYYLKHC